jgi:hypothetical protein
LDHNSRCASGPRGSGFQNARIHYLETAFRGIEDARSHSVILSADGKGLVV